MLQAVKLDSRSRPAPSRGRETGTVLPNQAFAGYLSAATGSPQMVPPCPSPLPEAEARTASPRTEPAPERPASRTPEADTERARPEEEPEEARQEASERASEGAERQAAPQVPRPERPSQAPEKPQEGTEPPADSAPSSPAKAASPAPAAAISATPAQAEPASITNPVPALAMTAPTGAALPAASASDAKASEGASLPSPPPAATETVAPQPNAVSKPQTALGPRPLTQTVADAPVAASKPALSELLSVPRPAMETPKPLLSAGKALETTNQELPTAQAPVAAKLLDAPLPQATAPQVSEAVLAVAPKTEKAADKPSASSPSIAVGGPAASVKGTTPVPALEGAQATRANATFEQVDGSIRWILRNQEKGAEIQLNPESLGRVVIKLRMEGGEVHAKVWASEASTLPVLQDQKNALAASLQQQGLSLGSFDLQQGRRGGDGQFQGQTQASGSGAGIALSTEKQQDLPTPAPILPGGAHLIEVLA